MFEAIHEAGPGVWAVLVAGALALAAGIRHAVSPRKESLSLVVGLCVTTAVFGVLGATLGVQASIAGARGTGPLLALGVRESLHNVTIALALVGLSAAAATIGSARRPG